MYATDPTSARQIREADLLVASESRRHGDFSVNDPRSYGRVRQLSSWIDSLRSRLAPTRHIEVGPLSTEHDLFRALNREQLTEVGERLAVRDCSLGQSLGRQNEQAEHFVVVLDAGIGVTIDGVPVTVLDNGSHFGAVPLLDGNGATHRASFDVLSAGKVAVADPAQFRSILDDFPTIAIAVYAMTRMRRERLAILDECSTNRELRESTLALLEYPVHLPA